MDNYIDVIQKKLAGYVEQRMFLCGNIPYNKLLHASNFKFQF